MRTPRVFLTATFIMLAGCGNFFESKARPEPSLQPLGADGPSFAEIKTQILQPHCIRCHGAYENYAVVRNDIQAIVNSVESNRMPKNSPPLDGSLKNLLRAWLRAGTPENSGSGSEPIDEEGGLKPTWDSLFVNVFAPRCTVCHSSTGQAPWIDLTSRAAMSKTLIKHMNFNDPAASYLVARLKDPEEPMPPLPPDSNLPQLTAGEVDAVIEWIRLGLP